MSWLRQLFSRRRIYGELSEEIREHVEEKVEELIASGMSRKEAAYAARREFGNVALAEEESRNVWRWLFLENFFVDVRHGLRTLRNAPGFTTAAIFTLALGIGANASIFSVSDAVLLKLLPARHAKELVYFRLHSPEEDGSAFSRAEFEQFRKLSHTFAGMFAFDSVRLVVNVNGQADFVTGQCVSGTFYDVLGVEVIAGRPLSSDDERSGTPAVAVISYDFWKRKFSLDPAVIRTTIAVKGIPFTIVGVTPEGFRGIELGDAADIWIPLTFWEQLRLNDHLTLGVMARMKPGSDERQAGAETTLIDREFAASGGGSRISAETEHDINVRSVELVPGGRGLFDLPDELPRSLLVLTMVVGFVLLIACANVANLLLARAVGRRREIALRLALGAPRTRLFGQLLTESLVLAVGAGALGLLLARWTTNLLVPLLARDEALRSVDVHTDLRTLCFAFGVSLLTCLLFGIAPAFWATRMDAGFALKGAFDSEGANRAHIGPRKILVIAQVSLSVLLLVGAGLLTRSLQKLSLVDAGFRQENVLLVSLYPTLSGYEGTRELALYAQAQERVRAAPGVLSASFSRFSMLSGGRWIRSATRFGSTSGGGEELKVNCNPITPHFFETMGIALIHGRDFTSADGQQAAKVAVVSESLARKYFPDEEPLGKPLRFKDGKPGEQLLVVGVVKEVKAFSLREGKPIPQVYIPVAQAPSDILGQITMEVRTAAEPAAVTPAIRDAMRGVNANLPVIQVITQERQTEGTLQNERSLSTLSTLFGILALSLACLGLYGIAAYSVATRTREIGIRIALGARPDDVHGMVIKQGMRLALAGVVAGLAGAFVLSRALASLLFGISKEDSVIYAGVSGLLLLVALVACYIPARRAARVDPMVALRHE